MSGLCRDRCRSARPNLGGGLLAQQASDAQGSDHGLTYYAKGSYAANNGIGPYILTHGLNVSNASTVVDPGPIGNWQRSP
jgi:hypothetical protein